MPFVSVPTSSLRLTRGYERALPHTQYVPALVYVLGCGLALFHKGAAFVLPRIEDDAFYYLVIAKNIATTGRSDFTPGVLTNGYQPLWMLAVVATGSLFGFTMSMLKALDIATIFAGFLLFARLFRVREFLASCFYVVGLWYVLETLAINGMESSLLFPGFVLFVAGFLSHDQLIAKHRATVLFFATVFCIGARLDSALFLLPILTVAPVNRRAKWSIGTGIAAAAITYALFNFLVFGSALPVSASVKSLGGFQLNHAYFAQFARELDFARTIRLRSVNSPYLVAVAVLVITLVVKRRNPALVSLPLAMIYSGLGGLALFALKLAFGSSWGVWTWYRFPELLFLLVGIWVIEAAVPATRLIQLARAAAFVCLAITQTQSVLADLPGGFAAASWRFIEARSPVLQNQTVAMGDRSGSFAYRYPAGVYQLEGLVNGVEYLRVLSEGGDLRQHLCEAHVPLVVSYEIPLGDYATYTLEVLRPDLTSFRGPQITVYRSEELTTFEDLNQYREENSRIYVWKLACRGETGS